MSRWPNRFFELLPRKRTVDVLVIEMTVLLKPILAIGNFFVRRIMRGRFHWLLSRNVVLLEIRGRKSGRLYLVPVNYREFDGGVSVMTYRWRKWWRNLRDGDEIAIWLRGKRLSVRVEMVTDDHEAIAAALLDRGWVRKSIANAKAEEAVLMRLRRVDR